jgi:SAM-dependent methyltransferase
MRWACDHARLAPGMRVLDIACGSGEPAFGAAARVRPGGHVVAIDIAPEMLAAAESRARRSGVGNIEFLEMDGEDLRFPDASFDAVTCACGLMFFPDVDRALAGIRRVLKPGGRLTVVVWDDPSKSSFLTAAGRAVAEFFPPAAPPNPNAPGAFRFAAPGALESTLSGAGFRDVVVESVPMPIEMASPEDYWEMFVEMSAGIAGKIASLSEADRARLKRMVLDAAARHLENGVVRLTATPLCAAATRDPA